MSVIALHEPSDTAELARRIGAFFDERLERLDGAARRCHALDDPEAVHDLRVAARRLEAALDVWRDALRAKPRRRARRLARRLRRAAGTTREFEVSGGLLAERLAGLPEAERAVPGDVLDGLRERIGRGRRRIAERLTPRRLLRLRAGTERALDGFARRLDQAGPLEPALGRLATRRGAALDALLAARPTLDDDALHLARVAVKRWRYAEEAFAAAGDRLSAPSPVLRELQRSLGAIHDRAALRDLLAARAARWTASGRASRASALSRPIAELEAERLAELQRFRASAETLPTPAA